MSKVVLRGFIVVPEADLTKVKAELVNHIALTQEEEGCLTFNVLQSADNPYHFSVYEEFTDKKSFEAHQARVKQSHWGKVTTNVERHYKISEEK
ncbi:antibiotic biosynthesis monooxygenase [Vibrio sp. 99-70-13A1]|uniref:putative quinol monooxygenase n=1 Tax=Vibrio sp. 99-70-13A1 TaxID=2607601 RepID=UPI0014935F5D|nr:antibiotic biosynthesis monooxygenase [Vibrio sp. 99-70-13A1]NOH98717.1 antibiotic biosynthesis monooxygenase [Vibrio sp. 99-70-13A1]